MKILLTLTALIMCLAGVANGQPKKFIPKYRDSVWYIHSMDTSFGTIQYDREDGIVIKGEGFLVDKTTIRCYQKVPANVETVNYLRVKDSLEREGSLFTRVYWWNANAPMYTHYAYIYTRNGVKLIYGVKYTFTYNWDKINKK